MIALVAITTGLVAVNLPDPVGIQFNREAERIAELLEAERRYNSATGRRTVWRVMAGGHGFSNHDGTGIRHHPWLEAPEPEVLISRFNSNNTNPTPAEFIEIGDEPVIGRLHIMLKRDNLRAQIETDGIQPFRASSLDAPP